MMKGQGSTEYLMVFGAVLLIALIAVVMLGFFPSLATDAQIAASSQYWRSEARPFAIVEHTISTGGNGSVLLENVDGRRKLTVTSITVGNGTNSSSHTFMPGDTYIFAAPGITAGGPTDAINETGANLTYSDVNGLTSAEYGSKALVGRYS